DLVVEAPPLLDDDHARAFSRSRESEIPLLGPAIRLEHHIGAHRHDLRWTVFFRIPMPSISTSTTSPTFMNSGGLRAKPTPSGVPVMRMSPASSLHPAENSCTRRGSLKTMNFVF